MAKITIDKAGGGGGAGSDTTAIHDDTASEISAISEKVTPVNADIIIGEDSENANAKIRMQVGNLPAGGGGEVNTASNINVAGVGVWKQKSTFDLQFRGILATHSLITVVLDDVNHEIELTIVESAMSLANLGTRLFANLSDGADVGSGSIITAGERTALHAIYLLTNDLASEEITQLQAIDSVTITNAQWAFVGAFSTAPLEDMVDDTTPQLGASLDHH